MVAKLAPLLATQPRNGHAAGAADSFRAPRCLWPPRQPFAVENKKSPSRNVGPFIFVWLLGHSQVAVKNLSSANRTSVVNL